MTQTLENAGIPVRTGLLGVLFFQVLFGAAALAQEGPTITESQGRELITNTPLRMCHNGQKPGRSPCGCPPLQPCEDDIATVDELQRVEVNAYGDTSGSSFVENMTLNHHHVGWDYHLDPAGGSCCGGGGIVNAPDEREPLPSLFMRRVHRYREMTADSSFGPGVFGTYDVKIYLYETQRDETLIDVFDPVAYNSQRFVDGPIRHPFDPDDPKDGVYVSFMTNQSKDLRLYDKDGNPVIDQAAAATAILTSYRGHRFHFEIIDIAGSLAGRLVKIENRNGYATTVTYKYPSSDGTDRQWQIDTVTDAFGRQAYFNYLSEQVSGRWVVSAIDLPNGESLAYAYVDGFLSGVTHPDGTQSTITITPDPDSGTTIVEYFDAAADGVHRTQKAYLSNSVGTEPKPRKEGIIPQAANAVRMIANGAGEVTYLSVRHDRERAIHIYEGSGRLKIVDGRQKAAFATDWEVGSEGFVVHSVEETYFKATYGSGDEAERKLFRGEPSKVTDETGRPLLYDFNAASRISKITHPDATTDLFEYNEFQQIVLHVDRLNRATRYTYDPRGNLLTETRGLLYENGQVVETEATATWKWEYFPSGHENQFLPRASIDANGNRTEYRYTPQHYLKKIIEPRDGPGDRHAKQVFTYDATGRLKTAADAVGRRLRYTYDARNRLTMKLFHDDSTEVFTYGAGGDANLLVEQKDRNGNLTQHKYDAAGREDRTIIAANAPDVAVEHTFTYLNGTGLVKTMVEKGEASEHTFDYRHRVDSTTVHPDVGTQLVSSRRYTRNELTEVRDPYGRKTFYVYAASDPYLIRTVREAVPDAVPPGTDVSTLPRDLTANAKYAIDDRVVDAEGQLLRRIDGRGIAHKYVYDSQGRTIEGIEAVNDPDTAAKTQTVYDAQGNVIRVKRPRHFTEPGGFITAYTYTGRNLLASVTEALGREEEATTSYTYDLDRRRKTTTDARGYDWNTLWHACCGRYQGSIDPTGAGDISNTDFYGNVTHTALVSDMDAVDNFHDPVGVLNETTTRYDARHRPVAQTVWLVDLGEVDPNRVPIAGEDGVPEEDGLTTRWTYDDDLTDGVGLDALYGGYFALLGLGPGSDGFAQAATNPENETGVAAYDGTGRTVMFIDGNGNASSTDYDRLVTLEIGAVVETASFDALNHVSRTRVDGLGRTIQVVDEEDYVTAFTYDANGNRLSSRDPNGVGQDCMFDARNRDVLCTDTHGDSTSRAYDAQSNRVKETDGLGHDTLYEYDPRNRVSVWTTRIGGRTTYDEYDGNSNLLSITDGEGHTTSYKYDPRNLKTKETFADGGAIDYEYDGARRLWGRIDQNLDRTDYLYDRANRLTDREYLDKRNDTFTYDRASRMLTAASARYETTVTRTYDDGGRLTSETLSVGGQDYVIESQYDADDRRRFITYPDGSTVERRYTPRHQLHQVLFDGLDVIQREYDPGMSLIKTDYANGLTETRTYRNDDRLKRIYTPGVTDFDYKEYNANKNILTIENGIDEDLTEQFAYDFEDRLKGWTRNDGRTQGWDLTLVGDWESTTIDGVPQVRVHNEVHELIAIDGVSLDYDPKGNLTRDESGSTFEWDFDNQLTRALVDGVEVTFTYDALGRRVSKSAGGITTTFICDGWQEIADYENGVLARRYLYATYIDDACLMVNASGERFYYHRNHIYSTMALTNLAGSIVETYQYTPYGKPSIKQSTVGNPLMFTARRYDRETRSHYYRTRYLHPVAGRFTTRDMIGTWGDNANVGNGYAYAAGNPSSAVDPTGSYTIDWKYSWWEADLKYDDYLGAMSADVLVNINPCDVEYVYGAETKSFRDSFDGQYNNSSTVVVTAYRDLNRKCPRKKECCESVSPLMVVITGTVVHTKRGGVIEATTGGIGAVVGGVVGAVVGSTTGAAVGTATVPVVGTISGATYGGIKGGAAGVVAGGGVGAAIGAGISALFVPDGGISWLIDTWEVCPQEVYYRGQQSDVWDDEYYWNWRGSW